MTDISAQDVSPDQNPAPAKDAPLSDPQSGAMVFSGADMEFRDLVRHGAVLEVVTFGFYRFWLATRIRQYLWSHTLLDGDAFSYHGTARELLIGFLFAVAILAPVNLVGFLLGVEAEREQTFASAFIGVFFIAFFQFAIYRARRYRLHRTSWRGLRFHLNGSGIHYALRALGWGLLAILTLGLAWPWLQSSLERYKMRHTYYGDLRGDFVATGGALFKRFWLIWFAAAVVLAGFIGLTALAATKKELAWTFLLSPLFSPAIVFLYARYKGEQWKWWVEGVRIAQVRAASTLSPNGLVGNYFIYAGLVILCVVIWSLILLAVFLVAKKSFISIVVYVLSYIGLLVYLMMLWRIYFIQRVWKIVVNSLTIHNLAVAEEVAMRPEADAPSALGEGFADSLDVGGF